MKKVISWLIALSTMMTMFIVPAHADSDTLTISNPIYSVNGQWSYAPGTGKVQIAVDVEGTGDATLIAALFDTATGRFVDADTDSVSVSNTKKMAAVTIDIESLATQDLKIFVWDSLSGMRNIPINKEYYIDFKGDDDENNTGLSNGIDFFESPITGDGYFVGAEMKNGVRSIRGAKPGENNWPRTFTGYLYFKATTDALKGDQDLAVTVEYFDEGTRDNILQLQYHPLSGVTASASGIRMSGANEWKTYTFILKDAYFKSGDNTGLGDGYCDFRIQTVAKDIPYINIRRVSVAPLDEDIPFVDFSKGKDNVVVAGTPYETVAGDSCYEWVEKGGEKGIAIPAKNTNAGYEDKPSFIYFAANRSFIQPTDKLVAITIDYFDEADKSAKIKYCNGDGGQSFGNSEELKTTGTNEWKTKTFYLTDAYFDQNSTGLRNTFDFRIEASTGFTVKRVQAKVGYEPMSFEDAASKALLSTAAGTLKVQGHKNTDADKTQWSFFDYKRSGEGYYTNRHGRCVMTSTIDSDVNKVTIYVIGWTACTNESCTEHSANGAVSWAPCQHKVKFAVGGGVPDPTINNVQGTLDATWPLSRQWKALKGTNVMGKAYTGLDIKTGNIVCDFYAQDRCHYNVADVYVFDTSVVTPQIDDAMRSIAPKSDDKS